MQVFWELPDGQRLAAEVSEGTNLMQAAVARGVPGVVGECGGSLSCATCHVVVAREWADKTGQPGTFEDDMLDVTEAERQPTSRLSCQIVMSAALDGIVVQVPAP